MALLRRNPPSASLGAVPAGGGQARILYERQIAGRHRLAAATSAMTSGGAAAQAEWSGRQPSSQGVSAAAGQACGRRRAKRRRWEEAATGEAAARGEKRGEAAARGENTGEVAAIEGREDR